MYPFVKLATFFNFLFLQPSILLSFLLSSFQPLIYPVSYSPTLSFFHSFILPSIHSSIISFLYLSIFHPFFHLPNLPNHPLLFFHPSIFLSFISHSSTLPSFGFPSSIRVLFVIFKCNKTINNATINNKTMQ